MRSRGIPLRCRRGGAAAEPPRPKACAQQTASPHLQEQERHRERGRGPACYTRGRGELSLDGPLVFLLLSRLEDFVWLFKCSSRGGAAAGPLRPQACLPNRMQGDQFKPASEGTWSVRIHTSSLRTPHAGPSRNDATTAGGGSRSSNMWRRNTIAMLRRRGPCPGEIRDRTLTLLLELS